MFQRVVVGLDIDYRGKKVTLGSTRALEQAKDLAQRCSTEIVLVHSTHGDNFVEVGEHGYVVRHEDLPAEGHQALEEVLESLTSSGIQASLRLREERPELAVTREVMESGADLVLLGKHNEVETGPRLGSVAARVLRKCPGTIWVVKPDAPAQPKLVLIATDLGPVGAIALRTGGQIAKLYDSQLHVFNAFQLPFAEGMHGEDSFNLLKRTHEEQARKQAEEAGVTDAQFHIGCTSPSRGIQLAQERMDVQLVVMGTVGRGGVPGFLLGNTAERVLPKVVGSLLVVKPDDFISPVSAS